MFKRRTKLRVSIRIIGVCVIAAAGLISIVASFGPRAPFPLTIAWTGPSQSVKTGSTVMLDARGSDFVDINQISSQDQLEYIWLLVSKPEGSLASLTTNHSCFTQFIADRDGVYEVKLLTNI